jgi:DNA-binding MarR family transcriptional regulator
MQPIGGLVKQRVDQVLIQNQMLKAGFAAFPYLVMKDSQLSVGTRLTYAFLLMYAWQEGSCFAGQEKMAEEMGISRAQLQRNLYELRDAGYIKVERSDKRYNNTYVILDQKRPTKLKARKKR